MSEAQHEKYIVVFKNYATNEQINHYMDMVRQSGGFVTHEYGSIMKGFAALLPHTWLIDPQSYSDIIDYIEPDGVVETQ